MQKQLVEAEGGLEELNSRLTTLNAKLTRSRRRIELISLKHKAVIHISEEVMRAELDLFEAKLEYQAIV